MSSAVKTVTIKLPSREKTTKCRQFWGFEFFEGSTLEIFRQLVIAIYLLLSGIVWSS